MRTLVYHVRAVEENEHWSLFIYEEDDTCRIINIQASLIKSIIE